MKMAFLFCVSLCVQAGAQTLDLSNGHLETRAAGSDSLTTLKQFAASETGPVWFGYAVESDRPQNENCCWTNDCRGCALEAGHSGSTEMHYRKPAKLESSRFIMVLFRVQNHSVGKARLVSEHCPIDAGGLRVVWFTGVSSQASVAFLTHQLNGDDRSELTDTVLLTLSMQAGQPASEALIQAARYHVSHSVRGKALFWLAQRAGESAAAAIGDSLQNDPDTDVKTKAVFALQQLPHDQGIPLLINIAKTHRNREVRKQAFFWLGQSGDPRALAFLADTLGVHP